ncbi:D-alanyl-D-alanine carboxypeptidase DacC [Entomobacter blattae]|uniref:serine-type D-Ala-D-Ala carboxypeptidase n=1 Tax=Entomobacter blattae TaxID=2762277 RepID=A0A7H1NT17_9PROT|nr:D-alanyl-D-alanine carboxypeptidase DacC [Entomobacter blattae]
MQTRRTLLTGLTTLTASAFLAESSALAKKKAISKAKGKKPSASSLVSDTGVPASTPLGPLDIQARWACILDYTTGAVLLEKAADERMPPSSLTKMMTIYIVFGMLKSGRLSLDQKLPVSETAWRMQGSKMFVPLGQSIAVQDLIQGVVIQSGNDACIVLAEGIAGSEQQFANLMNASAAKLNMTNSHFLNCTGWPEEGHYMSARDVATIAWHLVHDYPEYYHFFSEKEFRFNGITQGNRNVLVDKGLADGLKTGHTAAGGYGLCASSKRDERRIIASLNGMPSSNVRAHESERLMEWAFSNFTNVTFYRKDQVVETIPVWMGTESVLPLVSPKDVIATLPHGWEKNMKVSLDYESPIMAPINAGQAVSARLVISGNGISPQQIPLVAGKKVEQKGLIGRAFTNIQYNLGLGSKGGA